MEIKISSERARSIKWLLGKRYGNRKKVETLILDAVNEIVSIEAKKVVDENRAYVGLSKESN